MSARMLVAYATRYGSTQEVAEAVAATLNDHGVDAHAEPARDVRSLEGFDGVVLGTPLYIGSLHKDTKGFLERHRSALKTVPLALFALGPVSADEGVDGSRTQLDAALTKVPWLTPVAVEVFVGSYDPARLRMSDKLLAALPASPLHGLPARDDRDWEAIREWASSVSAQLQ